MIKFTKLKIKNKKGFAMAELLAVCIVVLTIFTILFSNYLPLVAEYENRSVYNNVTAQYAAHHFRKAYAEAIAHTATKPDNQNIEKIISGGFAGDDYITVYDKDDNNKNILEHVNDDDEKEIAKMLDEYEIEEIIITPYKLETLKENYPNTGKLYGYIKYLPTYKNHNDNGKEAYRIIIKSSEFGYATTPIKYENVSAGEQDPNHPVLSDNMIAVRYSEEENSWEVADSENSNITYKWYDYNEKMWANSIVVKKDKQSKYKGDDKLGTNIDMEDVLTMQVWIPRFKYTVWNYNADGSGNNEKKEFSIEIAFEEKDDKTGDITCSANIQGGTDENTSEICTFKGQTCTDSLCNGKTYTHPAFTFGDKELTGFWIGKFEISLPSNNCNKEDNLAICNVEGITPTIVPNKYSYRFAQLSTFANNIMAMNDDNNIYGFTSTDDTHMIKNMEWGAVTYLSHSEYGTCDDGTCYEVQINSHNSRTTGCGPVGDGNTSTYSTTSCNGYETDLGKYASTTRNIYGVYDMNGGVYEYVMGNMVSNDVDIMISGRNYSTETRDYYSGYKGLLYDSSNGTILYNDGRDYPDEKYYDKYSYNTSKANKKLSKLGDAVKEFVVYNDTGWYNDTVNVVHYDQGNSWFRRGGNYNTSGNSGIFHSESDNGYAGSLYSTRVIIVNE